MLKHIGGGAYGEVFLARSVTDGYRAIKVVWRSRFKDSAPYEREFEGVRRFAELSLGERRQMALLHVGRNDAEGFFYSVMELADDIESGTSIHPETYVPATLEEIRQRRGCLSPAEALSIGVDLASALANLHAAGLVHRDIKPANVILVRGVPKLADVGLVCVAQDAASLVGTPEYMAPESPGRPTADVYSFARTLYVLTFGRDPSLCPAFPDDVDRHPEARRLMELNEIILRACNRSPEERYADGAALLKELKLLEAGGSITRIRAMERGLAIARKAGAVLLAFAALAAVVGAWQAQDAYRERQARSRIELAERQRSEALRFSQLSQAQYEIAEERFGRARNLLRQAWTNSPESAPFEWQILWSEARGMAAHELEPAGAGVDRLAFSPDGTRLAGHSTTNGLVVWDVKSGRATARVPQVDILAGYSPRFEAWATRGADTNLQFWSHSGSLTASARHPPASFHTVLPDGRILIAQLNKTNDALHLLDPSGATSTISNTLASGTNRAPIWSAAVGSDGSRFLVERGSATGPSPAGRLETGRFGFTGPDSTLQLSGISWAIACAPDGRTAAFGLGSTGDIFLTSLSRLALQHRIHTDHIGDVQAIAFSPDSRWVATGGDEGTVSVWDTRETDLNRRAAHYSGSSGGISSLTWDATGNRLASGDQRGEVRVWSFSSVPPPLTHVPEGYGGAGGRAIPSDDDQFLAFSDANGRVRIDRLDGSGTVGHLSQEAFAPLAFIAGNRELVAKTKDSRFGVWDLRSLQPLRLFPREDGNGDSPPASAVSRDGRWLGTLSRSGILTLIDLQSGKARRIEAAANTHSIAAGETPESFVTASAAGLVESWDPASGSRRWQTALNPIGQVNEITTSLAGQVHVACDSGWIHSFQVREPKLVRLSQPQGSLLNTLAVSPDGHRLIAGYASEFISILDAHDLEERMSLQMGSRLGPKAFRVVSRATFSRSGRILVVQTSHGGIRIWRTD